MKAIHRQPSGVLLPTQYQTYDQWRCRFLERRLKLALRFGLFYFLSFLPLDLGHFATSGQKLPDLVWIAVNVLRIGILTGCWWLLKPKKQLHVISQRLLVTVFLIASWSLGLLPRFYDTWLGITTDNPILDPDLFGWALLFITQATLIPLGWPLHLASQLGVWVYYFGVNPLLGLQVVAPDQALANVLLNVFWVCCICNYSVYFYEKLSAANFHANQQLAEAQERSDRLLLNILPGPIAEQLKQGPRTIAESFSEVTVLFADLVSFTQLADGQPPKQVVELLNQVFSRFDHLAEHYQLEKIKTIGDAYMVVSGLPSPRHDHAQAIAEMALAMRQVLTIFNQEMGYELSIRIGIHTGPVVAGVIGLKKFAYDLWGDTVNTASRMESHGLPNAIQVSDITYDCLKAAYIFEARGPILIKGKGNMMTYLLKGRAEVLQ